jgi:protein required for attachment to host cells
MKIAHGTIVLAMDGSKMLLFENEGDEKYPVLKTLAHEETDDPPSRELGTDTPGRSFASAGTQRSSMEETDWQTQAEERYADRAAERLQEEASGREGGIIVLAPPHLLGRLRKKWTPQLHGRIAAEIDKDVVHQTTDDITETILSHSA